MHKIKSQTLPHFQSPWVGIILEKMFVRAQKSYRGGTFPFLMVSTDKIKSQTLQHFQSPWVGIILEKGLGGVFL
jgi:hypothetical protein